MQTYTTFDNKFLNKLTKKKFLSFNTDMTPLNIIPSNNVKIINTSISDNKNASFLASNNELKNKNEDIFTKKNIAIVSGGVLLATALAFNKKITNVVKSIFRASETTNVKPKYLYHMTSKGAYESILRDGKIKVSNIENGVFMTSYANLKDRTPKETLLRMVNFYDGGSYINRSPHKHSGSIFILKIPVEGLNTEKLGFRRIRLTGQDNSNISDELIKFDDYSERTYSDIINKPLEFIYKNEIPTDKIENAIEIKTDNWRSRSFIDDLFKKIK